jgi:DNA polymerase-3 subunit epsilon
MIFVYANYYYNFGFNVTCITGVRTRFNAKDTTNLLKAPNHEWIHFQDTRQSIATFMSYDWGIAVGLGVVLGYNNLRALDIDDCADFGVVTDFLEILNLPQNYRWLVKSGSKRGFHIIFFCEEHKFNVIENRVKAFKSNNKHKDRFKHIELRWVGHLVLPPSIHASTMEYEFMNGTPLGNPSEIQLEHLYELLNKYCSQTSNVSRVYVGGDDMGNVITLSKNNPKYGSVTLIQDSVAYNGMTYDTRSTIVMGLTAALEDLNLKVGEILEGKIVVREQTTPFIDESRDLKVDSLTGIVFSVNGQPIYRKTFYTDNMDEQDIFVQHDNIDEILEDSEEELVEWQEHHPSVGDEVYHHSYASDSYIDTFVEPYYLFFDTETTGVPMDWNAPVTDLDNWPRLVQLAYLLYDAKGTLISSKEAIIKPIGFSIPYDASNIHGITTEFALKNGLNISEVLSEFEEQCEISSYLVAHNINFDSKVLGAEYLRNNKSNPLSKLHQICTMEKSTNFCKIESRYGYKWPKLSELHYKLFGKDFDNAHNALADIEATAKCFWEMKKTGLI